MSLAFSLPKTVVSFVCWFLSVTSSQRYVCVSYVKALCNDVVRLVICQSACIRKQWLNAAGRVWVISIKLRCAMIRLINYSCQWGQRVLSLQSFCMTGRRLNSLQPDIVPCPLWVFHFCQTAQGLCWYKGHIGLTVMLSSETAYCGAREGSSLLMWQGASLLGQYNYKGLKSTWGILCVKRLTFRAYVYYLRIKYTY